MFPAIWRVLRSSLAATVAAYAVGICLTSTVAALGLYRVATSVLSEARTPISEKREPVALGQGAPERATAPEPAIGKPAQTKSSLVKPAVFGGSSRYWGRSGSRYREDDDDDEDRWDRDEDDWGERRQSYGAYRTLCVRLCDGYYFPISFSASRGRFERDAETCERSCPGQARLFVHPNPGSDVEDMVDLRGQPYRELKTAFLYRTQYVPSCKCKPEPWSAEAKAQHRVYALEIAARKGDQQAKAELSELTAKLQRDKAPVVTKQDTAPAAPAITTAPALADTPRRSSEEDNERMGLGARARERPAPRGESDWMARALGRP